MPTIKLNDRYDVTITGPKRLVKGFEVRGRIFDRQTQKPTSVTVRAEGQTIAAAQGRATEQARQKCPPYPDDE